jgi:hypothetical protein
MMRPHTAGGRKANRSRCASRGHVIVPNPNPKPTVRFVRQPAVMHRRMWIIPYAAVTYVAATADTPSHNQSIQVNGNSACGRPSGIDR